MRLRYPVNGQATVFPSVVCSLDPFVFGIRSRRHLLLAIYPACIARMEHALTFTMPVPLRGAALPDAITGTPYA